MHQILNSQVLFTPQKQAQFDAFYDAKEETIGILFKYMVGFCFPLRVFFPLYGVFFLKDFKPFFDKKIFFFSPNFFSFFFSYDYVGT